MTTTPNGPAASPDPGSPFPVDDRAAVEPPAAGALSADAPDDLRGTAIKSAIWVAVGKWGNQLAALLVFTLLSRLLAPADLGLAALATVFVVLFQLLSDQGFSTALVQKHEVNDDDRDTAFWISVATALVLVALTIGLSPMAGALFGEPRLGPVLIGMSPMILFTALAATPQALLERTFEFRSLSMRTLLSSVIGGIVGVVVALLGGGVWAVVSQSVTTAFVAVVFLWTVTPWRPRWNFSRRSGRELRTTGLSVLGIQLVALANAQGDKLIVGAFLGPTPLGYYFVGTRVVSILIDVQTSVIDAISLTTLSKMQHARERLRDAFYGLTSLGAATAIGTFALLAATADVSVPFVFGPQWQPAVPIMQILCLMGCINAIIVFDRNALIAVGAARAALIITVVQCVIGLAAVAGAVSFGVLAVTIAAVVRQYAAWPLRLATLRRHVGISIATYLAHWARPMASGLLTFAVGFLIARLWRPHDSAGQVGYLAVQAAVGIAVYAVSLRFTSRYAYDEIRSMVRALTAKLMPRRTAYARHRPRHGSTSQHRVELPPAMSVDPRAYE